MFILSFCLVENIFLLYQEKREHDMAVRLLRKYGVWGIAAEANWI